MPGLQDVNARGVGKLKSSFSQNHELFAISCPPFAHLSRRDGGVYPLSTGARRRLTMTAHGSRFGPALSPMRHANNIESVRTYEGTDEVHTLTLGQHITGIAATG